MLHRFVPLSAFLSALICSTFALPAFACPDNYSSNSLGFCQPNAGGDIANAGEKARKEAVAQQLGPILEQWVTQSRNTSITNSLPIPNNIRAALEGFISPDILNVVRYKVGDTGVLNLGNLALTYGDVTAAGTMGAITLIDVIVFANQDDALNNAALWAHELTHVKQYRDWGVHDFAIRYARDPGAVESEAYAVQAKYADWAVLISMKNSSRPSGPLLGKNCTTPSHVCPIWAPLPGPLGATCSCQGEVGQYTQ